MTSHASQPLRALVSTIEPIDGGVPTMTRWICHLLDELNIKPILAWYAPWSIHPDLSVPSYQVVTGKRPNASYQVVFDQYDGYAIGCWFPELEFTHYLPGRQWKKLISSCHLHLVVSGNPLCASPFTSLNLPFLAWVATPWNADRKDRVRQFSITRKLVDSIVNKPCIIKLEKSILSSSKGKVLSLSNYTAKELSLISYEKSQDVMYMPVDTNLFYPIPAKTMQWKIGFSGRYADPRKNLTLLLNSLQILVRRGFNPQLTLVGERKSSIVEPLIHSMGLTQYVTCLSNLPSIELASILQTLDVFAIPSHQEGLCIAALEAMACGVPIVSTRCGGPEDYVKSGITGELVENNPELFAAAIEEICTNKTKRQRLASGALDWIASNASQDVSRQQFRHHISDLARRRSYVLT